MSKTDKDNKHKPKHDFSTKCPEKNCDYCKASAKENRKTREARALRQEEGQSLNLSAYLLLNKYNKVSYTPYSG